MSAIRIKRSLSSMMGDVQMNPQCSPHRIEFLDPNNSRRNFRGSKRLRRPLGEAFSISNQGMETHSIPMSCHDSPRKSQLSPPPPADLDTYLPRRKRQHSDDFTHRHKTPFKKRERRKKAVEETQAAAAKLVEVIRSHASIEIKEAVIEAAQTVLEKERKALQQQKHHQYGSLGFNNNANINASTTNAHAHSPSPSTPSSNPNSLSGFSLAGSNNTTLRTHTHTNHTHASAMAFSHQPMEQKEKKEKKKKEKKYTKDQMQRYIAEAVEARENELRVHYDARLSQLLKEQFESFTQFNQDYVSRQLKKGDLSYIM